MFVFKKLIAAFLVPPGLVVLFLLAAAAGFGRRRSWGAAAALFVGAASLWGFSSGPVSNALLGSLESPYRTLGDPRGDVIVLLGGGVWEGAADLSGVGAPSEEMTVRLVTAVRLQKRLGVPVVVTGGTGFSHRAPEAPVVRRFLVDLGVPADRIVVEAKSRDTEENARFTAAICAREKFRRVLLVTSAFHMRRAVMLFERAGLEVTPVPAGIRTWPGYRFGWPDYLPSEGALLGTSSALRERIGLIYYGGLR